jgi:hypothetical protein
LIAKRRFVDIAGAQTTSFLIGNAMTASDCGFNRSTQKIFPEITSASGSKAATLLVAVHEAANDAKRTLTIAS